MEQRHQIRLLLAVSVVLIAAAVWFGGKAQRSASNEGDAGVQMAQSMLTARLDMETGLRGFLLTGREQFLQPYYKGLSDYRAAAREAGSAVGPEGDRLLAMQRKLTREWVRRAQVLIGMRHAGRPPRVAQLKRNKHAMDRFRQVNAELVAASQRARRSLEDSAIEVLLAIIAGLVLLSAAAGYLLIEHPSRRRKRERAQQAEFEETLQFASDEREAHALLGRELHRGIPGGSAVVLSRNNSENRLETATELPADSPLGERLPTATPSDCLAVRRGRPFERSEGKERLLECELCGATGPNSLCLPSLVGGEVIGSVLVSRPAAPLKRIEARRFKATVDSASPVLANLRNLAIAETRAVTDSLTGLANARAAAQDLDRMVAFAGRTGTPLTAIMLDLDHFKRINDTFGHPIGDEALAAIGPILRSGTRASDFIARYGGEEFLILLQDTDTAAGVEVAEKLREGARQMRVPGLTGRVTASFGVASIPAHAGDGDGLLRAADRALYTAKKSGRDQVRTPDDLADGAERNGDGAERNGDGDLEGAGRIERSGLKSD
jgi:diguanylate cyclase (GGDEF)-like protein